MRFSISDFSRTACWLLCVVAVCGLCRAEPEPEPSPYEKTLLEAGLAPTADGIGNYLRRLHPTDEQRSTALALINTLGSERFAEREKATQQLLLMPVLDTEALAKASGSSDPEVRWRAKKILAVGRPQTERLLYAAFKVIEQQQLSITTPQVIAAIPLCDKTHIREAARIALVAASKPEQADLLIEAAGSDDAYIRAAATAALGSALGEDADEQLTARLADDNEEVQLAAARAIANYGSRDSLPALLNLMQSEDVQIRTRSSLTLRSLTKTHFGFAAYDKEEKRREKIDQWETWVATAGKSAELHFPLKDFGYGISYLGGNTLLAFGNRNKVVELDPSGKEVWKYEIRGAWAAEKMPNGNVLIASNRENKIVEINREGKEVWSYPTPNPLNAKPLPNGNILIACFTQKKCLEVNREKKIVWKYDATNYVCDAHRLDNGNTLVGIMNGPTRIITPEGKTVWEYHLNQTYGCQPLANGNVLIASLGGKVVEVNREKKIVWEHNEQNPADAFRLPNGNTLITGSRRFVEVTPDKKIVWQLDGCQYGTARK